MFELRRHGSQLGLQGDDDVCGMRAEMLSFGFTANFILMFSDFLKSGDLAVQAADVFFYDVRQFLNFGGVIVEQGFSLGNWEKSRWIMVISKFIAD